MASEREELHDETVYTKEERSSTRLSEFGVFSHLTDAAIGGLAYPLAVYQELKSWNVFSLEPQAGLRSVNEIFRQNAKLGPKGESLASFLYRL